MVISSLVLSRIDYANALFVNIRKKSLNELQILQNAAVRLLLGIPKKELVLASLPLFHWLPIEKRINFKALCTAFRALHGEGPDFIRQNVRWYILPKQHLT